MECIKSNMLFSIYLLLIIHFVSASLNIRCMNSTDTSGITFSRVESRFKGRYVAEVCGNVDPKVNEWQMTVSYYKNRKQCLPRSSMIKLAGVSTRHSNNEEWIDYNNTCSNVCLSTNFDLIFSSCYYLRSSFFIRKGHSRTQWNTSFAFFNVSNPYTEKMFMDNRATVEAVNHKNDTTVIWHTGVPISNYEVVSCNDTNNQDDCPNKVTSCYMLDEVTIKCHLSQRCFSLKLKHIDAPWITGPFYKLAEVNYPNNCSESVVGVAAVSGGWRRGAWAACGAVCAGALAAAALCATRRAHALRKRALKHWLAITNNNAEPTVIEEDATNKHDILLLYARENEVGQRYIDALKRLLQYSTQGQVYDVYSCGTVRALAGGGPQWVRGALRCGRTRVVVVQSPALYCLYTAAPDALHPLVLTEPLISSRVVRRSPLFGDQLLQYALKLMADTPHACAYKKFFIAEISSLPTEVLPTVVTYKRYLLPEAVSLLVSDCGGTVPPPQELVDEFTRCVREFVELVKENPEYLMDELMVV